MNYHYQKWRDEPVFFLDDAFDCAETEARLVAEGFRVERFAKHFCDEGGKRKQNVKDPEVIRLCNKFHYILLTTDSDMLSRHRGEIEKCKNIGILATAHNTVSSPEVWVEAFIKLRLTISKNSFRKRQRPWAGTFDRTGKFSSPVRTIEPRSATKHAKSPG